MLARQQAAGERVVGDHPDALLGAQRQQLALDLTEQQVVAGLDAVEPGRPEHLAAPERPSHLVGEEVGAADVAHLAGVDQVVEGCSVSSIGVLGSGAWSW